MKKLYIFLFVCLSFTASAQIVTFTDPNFKSKLLSASTTNYIAKDINGAWMVIDTNTDNQIQLSEALQVYELYVSSSNIVNMTGIQSFTTLRKLRCSYNTGLTSLNLTNLTNLTDLNCSHDAITQLTLANVPALTTIDCSYNKVASLNLTAATAATTINASYMTSPATLDVTGLNSLVNLDVSYGNFNTININNLASLNYLACNNSRVVNLSVTNLPALISLYCHSNSFATPVFNNLPLLELIKCGDNSGITSLDLTNIPSLKSIDCDGNGYMTSFNFSSFPNLIGLSIDDAAIVSMDLTNLTKLEYLSCSRHNNTNFNQLQSLDVSGLKFIKTLDCTFTRITTLDLGAANQLFMLNFSYTYSMVSLNIKNNSQILNISDSTYFNNLFSGIRFICADEVEIASVLATFSSGYGTSLPKINTYCSIPPGGNYNTVNGIVKFDAEGNGCDSLDVPVNGVRFTSNINSPYYFNNAYSNASGRFNFYNYTGSLTVTPVVNNSFFTISPTSRVVTFNPLGGIQTANFCMTPLGTHNDLEVAVYPVIRPRPGFATSAIIVYKNNGNTTLSGTLNLNFDDNHLNYTSSSLPLTNQVPNILSWAFTNLRPFESKTITVSFLANTPTDATYPLNSGDQLSYTASLVVTQTDETPLNNTHTLLSTVVNSFDPNDKIVLEGSYIDVTKIGDYLHYIVNFQNTGTAEAVNVVIKDILSSTLNLSTLEMLASSHECTPLVNTNNRKVEFFFENIDLPATSVNEPGSHGFVAFKVKPSSSVVLGSVMPNTANIYFDYNAPIITNTVSTAVVALGTADFDFGKYFTLYPNPASTLLNFETKAAIGVKSIDVYNTLGQLVIAIPNAENITSIDVSDLKTGTYFIKVNTDKGTANSKFVKE